MLYFSTFLQQVCPKATKSEQQYSALTVLSLNWESPTLC